MANKEIKQTIKLEGEKEYNQAIRDANRNIRLLRSELEAETAELGNNASAQDRAAKKADYLRRQISEQERVVQTLRTALDDAQQNYGDNGEVVGRWQERLNRARTALGNMRNELDSLDGSIDDVNEQSEEGVIATRSFAEAIENIASVGDSVASAIEDIFTGMVDTIRDVVLDLWDLIGETAAKADNYGDVAGYWNTDPVKIQQWSNALSASGKELETLEMIVSRLALGGKEEDIASMLGLNASDFSSEWDYAIAVMDRLNELRKAGDEPDGFFETVFGERKAKGVMDLLNSWDKIVADLEMYNADEGGLGMSSEDIDTMGEVFTSIEKAKTSWEALKDSVAAGFGNVTLNVMANVNGSLEALNDILKAETEEERAAAIEKLEQNLTELFGKVADAIRAGIETLNEVGEELASSDDPVVAAIGTIMKDLADAFKWMTEHADAVKAAFETIFGVWLVARLASIAGQISSIVANIEVIKGFSMISGAGSAASAAGGAAGAAGTGAGAAGAAAGGSALGGLGGLAAIISSFIWARNERLGNASIRGGEGAIEKAVEDNDALRDAFEQYIENNRLLQERLDQGLFDGDETAQLYEKVNAATELLNSLEGHEQLLQAYSDWRQENALGNLEWVLPDNMFYGRDDVMDAIPAMSAGITDMGSKLDGVNQSLDGLPTAIGDATRRAVGGISVQLDGRTVGRMLLPYISGGIAQETVG